MKALVTGGTGFIGSHLVEALLQRGAMVRCLVRKTSDLTWLKTLPVTIVYGDCIDRTSLSEVVRDIDQVFHLAGVTKAASEQTYFDVNAYGTQNLVHACLESDPRPSRFIYLSSQAAAGPSRNGCKRTESDECEPVSPYGRSKRLGEELALAHRDELPLVILRPPVVYGPREKDLFVYVRLIAKRIQPFLTGQERRFTLCYVGDVIDALLLASDLEHPHGHIFFLSDGTDYLLKEIGDVFAQALNVSPWSIPLPRWALYGVATFSEFLSKFSRTPPLISKGKVDEMVQRNWVCDITRARTLLCFEPRVKLPEGAQLTVDWYRKAHWL
jgi:nucleoside-diphosphate-sugar epimerase